MYVDNYMRSRTHIRTHTHTHTRTHTHTHIYTCSLFSLSLILALSVSLSQLKYLISIILHIIIQKEPVDELSLVTGMQPDSPEVRVPGQRRFPGKVGMPVFF
jgi:hypothetical protein